MSDFKKKTQSIYPFVQPRNLSELSAAANQNIYEALNVVARRANQAGAELKQELQQKLDEFSSVTDTLEEVQENKEQIEISRSYERLPNPAIIALHEYIKGSLQYRFREEDEIQ